MMVGRRLLLAGLVWAGSLAASGRSSADEIADRYCPQFHAECVEAKAQGYRDVGICNVERLECSTASTDDRGAGKIRPGSPAAREGERSVGP
jgi:hypothetical protein